MNGRCWTSDEIATLKRMLKGGRTHAEIGVHLKRHPDVVRHKCADLDLKRGSNPALYAYIARLHLRRLHGRVAA